MHILIGQIKWPPGSGSAQREEEIRQFEWDLFLQPYRSTTRGDCINISTCQMHKDESHFKKLSGGLHRGKGTVV